MKKDIKTILLQDKLEDLKNRFERDQKDKWKIISDLTNEVLQQKEEIKKLKEASK